MNHSNWIEKKVVMIKSIRKLSVSKNNSHSENESQDKNKIKWSFGNKFRVKSKEIPEAIVQKVLVDQGQQYDENDILEYFYYDRRFVQL